MEDNRKMFYGAGPLIFRNAKELREKMTIAEAHLWSFLSKKQLGVRFKAQHPIGEFIADFYCHQAKMVIEVDGKIHEFQKEKDKEREAILKEKDLIVVRFTNEQVLNETVETLHKIKKELKNQIPL